MTKLHLHYLHTEKPGSQFPPAKCAQKHPRKSDISGNNTGRRSTFLLKNSLPTDALHTPY